MVYRHRPVPCFLDVPSLIIIIKGIYIAQVRKGHKCAMSAQMAVWLRNCLPTVILTVIWYSITHSLFRSRLKTFLLYKSFPL